MTKVNGFIVWDEEFENKHFTPEEIAESDLSAAIMCAIIQARNERGLSLRDLEALTGIKRPQLAKMESGDANPRLRTLVRLLAAMGKKLVVVPLTVRQE